MDSGCSILFIEEPIANDIAARVKWGTSQQIVIYEFDPNSGGEKILVDRKALSLAFLVFIINKVFLEYPWMTTCID